MLELNHIQKAFDGVPVLRDISLQVEDGEIVSILGPSGCLVLPQRSGRPGPSLSLYDLRKYAEILHCLCG